MFIAVNAAAYKRKYSFRNAKLVLVYLLAFFPNCILVLHAYNTLVAYLFCFAATEDDKAFSSVSQTSAHLLQFGHSWNAFSVFTFPKYTISNHTMKQYTPCSL